MPNPENLIPCKPGETHNPNGRPKGRKNISTYLKELLQQEIEVTDPITKQIGKKKIAEVIAVKLVGMAIKGDGDRQAINDILDRDEGKPLQIQKLDANVKTIEIIDVNIPESENKNEDASNQNIQAESESE